MPERAGLSHAIFPGETDVAYRQTTDRHQNVALRALCAMASVTTKLKKRAHSTGLPNAHNSTFHDILALQRVRYNASVGN